MSETVLGWFFGGGRSEADAVPFRRFPSIDGIPGAELIARIRSGDAEAFACVYRAFHVRLWRFALTLVSDDDLAHEVVQDVFASLWARRATVTIHDDVTIYLFAAVRHRAQNVRRHLGVVRRFQSVTSVSANAPSPSIPIPGASAFADAPDVVAERASVREKVQEALGVLEPRERAALLLRWGEERTYDDIGRMLGITAMGAHKMVARAMARLRPLLDALHSSDP